MLLLGISAIIFSVGVSASLLIIALTWRSHLLMQPNALEDSFTHIILGAYDECNN